jgi:hypothetical protein
MRQAHARRWGIAQIVAGLAVAVSLAAGCSGENGTDGPPQGATYDSITVDASAGWAAVRFGDPAVQVAVSDLASSDAWDIAFNATSVMLNGGDAGPGEVSGYCVCQNAAATDEALTNMTPASELADFLSVTSAQVPSDADAFGEVFAASKWYRYNLEGEHQIWPTYDVYLIRRGGVVYKVQITGYYSATGAARHITFRYAPLAS